MTFFTRKGLPVPDLPDRADFVLPDADLIEEEDEEEDDEEDKARETAIAINTALVASNNRNKNLSENHLGITVSRRELNAAKSTASAAAAAAEAAAKMNAANANVSTPSTSDSAAKALVSNKNSNGEQTDERYDYVVDRNYGVEV